jgi:glutaredoxin
MYMWISLIYKKMGNDGNEIQATLLGMTGQRTVPNIFIKVGH